MNLRLICFITLASMISAAATNQSDPNDPVLLDFIKRSCFQSLRYNHTVSLECFKFSLSKGCGYGIVLFSAIVKVPQITKIYNKKSVAGLSLAAFFSEVIGLTVVVGYNIHGRNPFSTYGENYFLLLQAFIIFVFFPLYDKEKHKKGFILCLTIWMLLVTSFMIGVVPMAVYRLMTVITIVINIASRFPQIIENCKNKSTGQLSFATSTLNFVGTGIRIYTTVQEVADSVILAMFVNSTTMNGILFLQCLFYRNSMTTKGKHCSDHVPQIDEIPPVNKLRVDTDNFAIVVSPISITSANSATLAGPPAPSGLSSPCINESQSESSRSEEEGDNNKGTLGKPNKEESTSHAESPYLGPVHQRFIISGNQLEGKQDPLECC